MGTYRTNKAIAFAAYKIEGIELENLSGVWSLCLSETKYTEFGSPVYCAHKWTLGDLECHEFEGEGNRSPEEFMNVPLYKVVQRGGEAFLLFLKVYEDSVIYAGGAEGPGVYFETSLPEALKYYNTNGQDLDWTDIADPDTHILERHGEDYLRNVQDFRQELITSLEKTIA